MIIDRKLLKNIRPEIESALAEVGKAFDVSLTLGNASYNVTGDTGHFKLEVSSVDADGTAVTPALSALRHYYPHLEGHEVKSGRKTFKIDGYNTKAPKFCWIATGDDGKSYKLPDSAISRELQYPESKLTETAPPKRSNTA